MIESETYHSLTTDNGILRTNLSMHQDRVDPLCYGGLEGVSDAAELDAENHRRAPPEVEQARDMNHDSRDDPRKRITVGNNHLSMILPILLAIGAFVRSRSVIILNAFEDAYHRNLRSGLVVGQTQMVCLLAAAVISSIIVSCWTRRRLQKKVIRVVADPNEERPQTNGDGEGDASKQRLHPMEAAKRKVALVCANGSNCTLHGLAHVSSAAGLAAAKVSSAANLAVGLTSMSSAASFARLSTAANSIRSRFSNKRQRNRRQANIAAISATEPFVSLELVGDLTLEDLAVVMRYVRESQSEDFDLDSFFADLRPALKQILVAIDDVTSTSRGEGTAPCSFDQAVCGVDKVPLDIDVLLFCAAVRIFAEWRILRLVPEGYQAYAVGMNLARRDLVQNMAKIEKAAHAYLDQQRELASEDEDALVASPTLRELLAFEVRTKVHPRLPRLNEKSGAIGLLWLKRQVEYQARLFSNILDIPGKFEKLDGAVSDAYQQAFGPYHGWIVQQTFQYSFRGAPSVDEIYQVMKPTPLSATSLHGNPASGKFNDSITNTDPSLYSSCSEDSSPHACERDLSIGEGNVPFLPLTDEEPCGASSSSPDDPSTSDIDSKEEPIHILSLGYHVAQEWEKFVVNLEGNWKKIQQQLDPKSPQFSSSSSSSNATPSPAPLPKSKPPDVVVNVPTLIPEPEKHQKMQSVPSSTSKSTGTAAPSIPVPLPDTPHTLLTGEALDRYERTMAAHNEIRLFLAVVNPMVSDISNWIDEYNMNDPSKV